MVDPIVNAANLFVGIYTYVPFPIRALVGLSLGLFLVRAIAGLFWSIR